MVLCRLKQQAQKFGMCKMYKEPLKKKLYKTCNQIKSAASMLELLF